MSELTAAFRRLMSDKHTLDSSDTTTNDIDQNWNKILIVFDYNGTLAKRIGKQDYLTWDKDVLERRVNTYNASQMNDSQKTYIFHRPGIQELQEFFTKNSEFISYSLWTSKNEDSMSFPLEQLKNKFDFVPKHSWFGDYIKDLKRINKGYNIDNILLVDDTKVKANINKNFINIKSFRLRANFNENVDSELFKLIEYLNKLLSEFKSGKSIYEFMSYEVFNSNK